VSEVTDPQQPRPHAGASAAGMLLASLVAAVTYFHFSGGLFCSWERSRGANIDQRPCRGLCRRPGGISPTPVRAQATTAPRRRTVPRSRGLGRRDRVRDVGLGEVRGAAQLRLPREHRDQDRRAGLLPVRPVGGASSLPPLGRAAEALTRPAFKQPRSAARRRQASSVSPALESSGLAESRR